MTIQGRQHHCKIAIRLVTMANTTESFSLKILPVDLLIYLTPMVVCKSVHTPHMKRNVDIICDLTRSRSPAHISLATINGMDMVELMLSNTCWKKENNVI